MDAPDTNQIETLIADLEDSTIFSFIEGLSPLKPVNSTLSGQMFTSLGSFVSPPFVFTSPVSSRKQFGLLGRRHCSLEPTEPEISASNGNENISNTRVLDIVPVSSCPGLPPESFDPGGGNIGEDVTIKLHQDFKYGCSIHESNLVPSLATVTDPLPVMAGTLASLDHHVQDMSIEKLASNVFVMKTPKRLNKKQVDSNSWFYSFRKSNRSHGIIFNPKKRKVDNRIISCGQHEVERPFSKLVSLEKRCTNQSGEADYCGQHEGVNKPNEKTNEMVRNGIPVSHNQKHKIRRRSLVFEMSRTHKITLEYDSNSSPITSKFDDKQLVPFKSTLGSSTYFPPCTGCAGNEILIVQDAPQSAFEFHEELNQSSRNKNKRCSVKHDGEREGRKGCGCKNSKCLKLYCNCFAAGIYCVELCSCQDCFNKTSHKDTVLDTRKKIESRNPLAFSPKVIWSSESGASTAAESDRTSTSARHTKGCKCKKSRCVKKYCECYKGGAGCSISCSCLECENIYGRKDVEIAEPDEEETESFEKNRMIESLPYTVAQKSEEQCLDHIPPQTPSFHICRPSFQLPCSSGAKPHQAEYSIGASVLPLTRQTIESDYGHPLPKVKFNFQIIPYKGAPAIPSEISSPFTLTKTASPNSKKVTPPRNGFGGSSN